MKHEAPEWKTRIDYKYFHLDRWKRLFWESSRGSRSYLACNIEIVLTGIAREAVTPYNGPTRSRPLEFYKSRIFNKLSNDEIWKNIHLCGIGDTSPEFLSPR
jgi:hypothetical protein